MINHKQRRILAFIKGYTLINDEAPTLREIGDQFGFSAISSVHEVLLKLERAGFIKRTKYISRGIEIVEERKAA